MIGPQVHGFTLRANGIAGFLMMPIVITLPGDVSKQIQVQGLWDTGASMTVITKKVVDALGLLPTGIVQVNTASESNVSTSAYTVDLFLKQDVRISALKVNQGKLEGFDCLIGMDIITLGDFSITNLHGKTCMSFRIPSQHELDFVHQIKKKNNRDFLYKSPKRKK